MAGVLVSNFSSDFWLKLTEDSEISFGELKKRFDEIRRDLWTGKMKEFQLWDWFSIRLPNMNREAVRKLLMDSLQPLPALDQLERWAHRADLHILSNHCKEWLEPLLPRIEPHVRSITISNQVGLCKPHIEIFRLVESRLGMNGRAQTPTILYVDDQEKNLKPARSLGWRTVLADQDHQWLQQVEAELNASNCS